MLEGLISQLLNQLLGEFIDDVQPDQLNLSLLKGEVLLQNMAIKASLFDTLPVPFTLVFGKIGRIKLDVPISNIFSRPLIIEVSDIFLVLRPKPMSEWKEEIEIKAFRESTKKKLESFEVFNQGAEKLAQKEAGTTEKMLEQIVLNTKIDIQNVFVRLEDDLTSKKRGSFTIEAGIRQIFIGNCNENWLSKEFNKNQSEFVRKLVQLKDFGLSLDWKDRNERNDFFEAHELYNAPPDMFREILNGCLKREGHKFLLDDFNLECRLEANKKASQNLLPQIVASLILGGLHDAEKGVLLNLHQPQIAFLMKLIEYIGFYNEFTQGALKQYFERTMSLEETKIYIKLYLDWRQKEAKKNKKEAEQLKLKLWEMEQYFPYEKIYPIRQIALKFENKEKEKHKGLEEIRQKALEMKSSKLGWKGSLFSSKESKQKIEQEIEEFQKTLENQIQEKFESQDTDIQHELEQVTNELNETQQIIKGREEMLRIGPNYIGLKSKITLPKVQVRLFNEFQQEILLTQLGKIDLTTDIGGNFIESELLVESFEVKDLWTGSESFSDLIFCSSKEVAKKDGNILGIKVRIDETNLVSPLTATIGSEKTFFLVLNLESFQEISRTMLLAVKEENFDFTFFSDLAGLTAVKYRKAGKEFLDEIKEGEIKHKSFRLTAHLQPPLVFLPQDILDRSKPVLLINTGDLWATSYLQEYDKNINYGEIDCCKNFYDEYRVDLKDIKVSLLHKGLPNSCLLSFIEAEQYILLERTEIQMRIFKGLVLTHQKLVAMEALLQIKGLDLRLHQQSIIKSLDFNRNLQNRINQLQRTLIKSIGDKTIEQFENEISKQRNMIMTQVVKSQQESEEIQEEMKEDKMLMEIRDEALEKNRQKIEQVQGSVSFNLVIQVDRVSLELSELKNGKTTPYTLWKLQNLGFFLKNDSEGNSKGIGQVYNLVILNTYPQTNLFKDFKCILASPDKVSQDCLNENQSLDDLVSTSVLKYSVTTQLNFDTIEQYLENLNSIKSYNQLDFQLQMFKEKLSTQAQLKELRFIFSIPTIEKLYKYQNFILPKLSEFENLNYQDEILKLKSLKILNRVLDSNKVTEEIQKSLLFRNLVNLSKTHMKVVQSVLEEEIQTQQVIVDSFIFVSFQSQSEKKPGKEEEKKGIVSLQNQDQVKKEFVQERERKFITEFHLNLEGLTIFVPLNSEFPKGQLLSISLTSNFFYFQEQEQTVFISLETLQQLSIRTNAVKDESHFNVNEIRIETFKSYEEAREFQFSGFDENHNNSVMRRQMDAPQAEENEASVQILESANLTGFMKNSICNGNHNSDMRLTLDPLIFKIGFYQINFLCHLAIKIQKTIERRISEVRENRIARGIKVPNQKQPVKEVKEVIKNVKWNKSQRKINFNCDKIQFVIIDDTRLVAKNLLEINIKSISSEIKQFEEILKSEKKMFIKSFLYKIGVKPNFQQQFLKLGSSFEFEIIYLNNQNLLYEPFIEPLLFRIEATQLDKDHYLKSKIQAGSELNLNLTQAFAMALGKIRNSFEKSMKKAHEAYKDPLMPQENESKMTITSASISLRQSMSTKDSGYLFKNNLGVEVELIIDTFMISEEEEEKGSVKITKKEEEKIILLPGVDNFFSLTDMNQMLKRKYKNSEYNEKNIMQHNLSCELHIVYLQKLKNMKFNTLGVHAYSTKWSKELPHENADIMKKEFVVLANVQIEGHNKVVSFESSLLAANLLKQPVLLGAGQSYKQDEEDQFVVRVEDKLQLLPGEAKPLPLFWFLHQMSLYVNVIQDKWQMVTKNLLTTFKPNFAFKAKDAKLYQIQPNFYAAFNFTGLKCKPKAKSTPDQNLITIYAPMVMSNFCFNPMNFSLCNDLGKKNIALLAPGEQKEVFQVNKKKDSILLVNMALQEYSTPIFGQFQNFYCDPHLKDDTFMTLEGNAKQNSLASGQEVFVKSFRPLDLRNQVNYQDQLELRQVSGKFTSSQEMAFYPEYLLVNQTKFTFQIKFGDKVSLIGPKSNKHFSQLKKIQVTTYGYGFSKAFDVTTIGVSGEIEMELLNEQKAIQSGQFDFATEKLSFGISINRCPEAFSRTTAINIVPRFTILNKLDAPIAIRQKDSFHQKFYFPKSSAQEESDLSFLFEMALNQEIQIRRVTKKEIEKGMNYDINQEVWSDSIDISHPEDFQLTVPDKEYDEEEVLWYKPQLQNNFQRFVRIMITTKDQATLQVVLLDPITPETTVHNKTFEDIAIFTQSENQEAFEIPRIALKQLLTPIVLNKQKKIKIHIGRSEATILLKELQKKKAKIIPYENGYYKVGLAISGNCKSIIVEQIEDKWDNCEDDDEENKNFLALLIQNYSLTTMIVEMSLPGIALSFVDNKPQETLLASFKNLEVSYRSFYSIRTLDGMLEENQFFYIGLRHLQLDNMASEKGYPVILAPEKNYRAKNLTVIAQEEEKVEVEEVQQGIGATPFFQAQATLSMLQRAKSLGGMRIKNIEAILQKFLIQVDSMVILDVLSFIEVIQKSLFQSESEFNLIERVAENYNEIDLLNQMLKPRESYCKILDPNLKLDIDVDLISLEKIYIDELLIGAIHCEITFQLDKKAIDFKIVDLTQIVGNSVMARRILTSFVSISDSPLNFQELQITDRFDTYEGLSSRIALSYTKEVMSQLHTLLGSSDLIGNPTSLIGSIQSGVHQMVTQPKKGARQDGALGFISGVSKGYQDLTGSVLSGTMGSVSNVTGGLYRTLKTTTGQKTTKTQHKEDFLSGLVGAGDDMVQGFKGIVQQPMKGAKKQGVHGFFKGVGKGLLGVATAPVAAVLRVGSAATGEASSFTRMKRTDSEGCLISAPKRIRQPRYISLNQGLQSYNGELAKAAMLIKNIDPKIANSQIMKYYAVPRMTGRKPFHFVLTQTHVILIDYRKGYFQFQAKIGQMKKVVIAETVCGSMIKVKLLGKKGERGKMHFIDSDLAYRVFDAVKELPEVEAEDKYQL